MTKRLVGWLVLVPFCIVLILFALANQHLVEVQFDPLMTSPPLIPSIKVPMFLVIYGLLITGIVFGGMAAWFAQGDQRRQKRQWRNRAQHLENERDAAKTLAHQNRNPNEQNTLFDT